MPRAKISDQTRKKPIVLGAPEHRVRVRIVDEVTHKMAQQIVVHAPLDEVAKAVTDALTARFNGKNEKKEVKDGRPS